jgi:hypothetical protein
MPFIYVLSDPLNAYIGRYIIGPHTETLNDLMGRYITSISELKIYYFVETNALDMGLLFK